MTQSTPCILINHLTYSIPNQQPLFKQLSLAFGCEKSGIVGRNGVGKSSLLKLIIGEISADSGSIVTTGRIAYCPQELATPSENNVAGLLGISAKLRALAKLQHGSTDEADFLTLGDDWLIKERTQQQLAAFGLDHLALDRSTDTLSGGEKTRLLLANVFLSAADFIILDEPTNNLDISSRNYLYNAIAQWQGGLLIVSHDRILLNLMTQIIELTSQAVTRYGGNYDDYVAQKEVLQCAEERRLLDAKKLIHHTQSAIQARHEQHEQKKSRGRKLARTGSIDKLTANSKRGRSEKTQRRHATLNENVLKAAQQQFETAKSKLEICRDLTIDLAKTQVPNGKIVAALEKVTFYYDSTQRPIIDNFSWQIAGPQRIALTGENGSGKTTLIKLLLGQLTPQHGKIYRGVAHISYLDQSVTGLRPELSILANFMLLNPNIREIDARFYLAQFLFRNTLALKRVNCLSGGEKLRAMLACVLMSQYPPQLLILDEPTNHLDLDSIASIESALRQYQGALIVISHDETFLNNINIHGAIHALFS